MKEKISYLDETLKRLPIIALGLSCAWYGITKLNSIEQKIEKIELLSFKDKEAIDEKIESIQLFAANNSNRTNELEKNVIRLMAIMPNRTEVPKIKENED
jgi:hypothetical protein